ncbi:MAG: hypothetical protein GVY10_07650 [Verrucomicrobia bacterium]|jgi:hypothetical protein|nr:hypothetical protein [Verrucomicrobiota bacterium]
MRRDAKDNWLLVTFWAVIAIKLFLVADQEIYGRPFDDLGYARSVIDHYYGTNPNLNWQFIRPLGFPVFGALCMETGIPYRICIELFFLGAAVFFCLSLRKLTTSRLLAFLAMVALAFHPWVLTGFNQFMTEPYFLGLLLFFTGILLRLLARTEWRLRDPLLWSAGLLLAVLMLTRREGPFLYGLLATAFVLRFLYLRFGNRLSWKASAWPMLYILVPVLFFKALMLGVSGINYLKWGIFATNEQEAPGFSQLLNTLYRIDTPDPSLWAPVTRKTLEMAMEESPRFAELRQPMFNRNNPHLHHGEATTGRKGELGAWMWWRLYASLAATGIYQSPEVADKWMRATAGELDEALEEGRLPERGFSTPFPIDPNIGIWLPELPGRTLDALARLFKGHRPQDFIRQEGGITAVTRPVFNEAANRRASLLTGHMVDIRGYAFCSDGALDFIALESEDGTVLASTSPEGVVYWKEDIMRDLTGDDEMFPIAYRLRHLPQGGQALFLSFWEDGERLHRHPLDREKVPYRKITEPQDGHPAVDFSIDDYHHPLRDGKDGMRAMLEGWAFCSDGVITHVSLRNAKEQLLKVEEFTIDWGEDMRDFFANHVGHAPDSPLGFHIETPVVDLSPVIVQFWREQQLIHEMPLRTFADGYYGTVEKTASGIPLTIGIAKQQIPTDVFPPATFREGVRLALIRGYYPYLILLGLLLVGGLLARQMVRQQPMAPPPPLPLAGALLLLLALLLGRGLFYGLVEAAVVPDQSRYMDCAAPFAGVVIAVGFAAVLLMGGIYLLPRFLARSGPSRQPMESS